MMMKIQSRTLNLVAAALLCTLPVHSTIAQRTPNLKITHKPAAWGVKGQALTLKARVDGGVGGVNKVTLYYALFRDAAPFRVNMASSGIGLYVGTIEAGLLSGVETISYYIEAEDKEGTIEETSWYDVTFKDADPSQRTRTVVSPTGSNGGADGEESSAMTVGLIAGGAAAIAVGAYVISDSGGGSSSGGNPTDPGDSAGNYSGNSTTCITIPPSPTVCSNASISILIDPNGKVFSDTLLPGVQLVGDLNGNSFSLSSDVSNMESGFTGTIIFSGNVVGSSTIVGDISGTVSDNGSPGFYSGDFSASK